MYEFTVRVPATSANLGPGFDCLGLALDLEHTLTVEVGGAGLEISLLGEGADELPADHTNLVYRAMGRLAGEVGATVPAVRLTSDNEIPLARGLGSSAAAVVAGLIAADRLLEARSPIDQLLQLATEFEGHPDNVAPALLGGCVVAVQDAGRLWWAPVPLPDGLRAVLFIPDLRLPTAAARAVLPAQVSRQDAVFNVGRAALLVAALATGRGDLLRPGTQDRLHQPHRSQLFPALPDLIAAAVDAGALGACLSGAGSTVLALAEAAHVERVGQAFAAAAQRRDLGGHVRIARLVAAGARVEPTSGRASVETTLDPRRNVK